jgi:hypothetical protein
MRQFDQASITRAVLDRPTHCERGGDDAGAVDLLGLRQAGAGLDANGVPKDFSAGGVQCERVPLRGYTRFSRR